MLLHITKLDRVLQVGGERGGIKDGNCRSTNNIDYMSTMSEITTNNNGNNNNASTGNNNNNDNDNDNDNGSILGSRNEQSSLRGSRNPNNN